MGLNVHIAPQRGRRREAQIWFWFSVMAFVAICGYLWWYTKNKQQDIALIVAENHSITQELAPFDQLVQQKKDTVQFKANLEDKLREISKICRMDSGTPVNVLEELADLIPTHLFIQKFSLTSRKISISGEASKMSDVTNFVHALEESSNFIDPVLKQLGSTAGMQSGQTGLVPFTITAQRKS